MRNKIYIRIQLHNEEMRLLLFLWYCLVNFWLILNCILFYYYIKFFLFLFCELHFSKTKKFWVTKWALIIPDIYIKSSNLECHLCILLMCQIIQLLSKIWINYLRRIFKYLCNCSLCFLIITRIWCILNG